MAVTHIDVSRWQGQINWNCMKNNGIKWAAIRATVSNYYKDDRFDENADGAKANNIMRPPYHVTRADKVILGKDNSALAQMDYFAKAIEGRHDGVVVLDAELYFAYGSTTNILPPQQITDVNMACVDICNQRYDAVYFYSRASFMDSFMNYDPRFATLDLFMADYGLDNGIWHGLHYIPKGCVANQVVIQQYTQRGMPFCIESKALDYDIVLNGQRYNEIHYPQPPVEEPPVEEPPVEEPPVEEPPVEEPPVEEPPYTDIDRLLKSLDNIASQLSGIRNQLKIIATK